MPSRAPCDNCGKPIRWNNSTGMCHTCAIETGAYRNDPRHSCPVTIRGVTYPSIAEAARKIGVAGGTVLKALDRGTLDDVGLSKCGRLPGPIPKQSITLGGKTYESLTACSKATGVEYKKLIQMRYRWKKTGKPPTAEFVLKLLEDGRKFLESGGVPKTNEPPRDKTAKASRGRRVVRVVNRTQRGPDDASRSPQTHSV